MNVINIIVLLGVLLCVAAKTSEDYRVHGLNKYQTDPDVTYAGMMPLDNTNAPGEDKGEFFFWLAETRADNKDKAPLIVWLNGGPGCSSMVGMMFENGPWLPPQAGKDGHKYLFDRNSYSWNEVGHVMYIEQPLRTGFSNAYKGTDLIRDEYQVADDFYAFLISFYKAFPDFVGTPLIISGESYAGKYIPNIAQEVVKRQLSDPRGVRIDLAGVAIGNGAIDPIQDLSHADYAYFHGLIPLGAKLAIEKKMEACVGAQPSAGSEDTKDALGVSADAQHDASSLGELFDCDRTMMTHVLLAAGQPNEYNTATFAGYDTLMAPDGIFHSFFNDAEVQHALHITDSSESVRTWAVCNDQLDTSMANDRPVSSVPALQFLANHTRVLLYAGENDLNCNFLGLQQVLQRNSWRGQGWEQAERSLYRGAVPEGKEVAGEYFSINDGHMAFLIIRNSGHLVPMDVPATAQDLIRRFAAGNSFADTKLPNEAFYLTQLAVETRAEEVQELKNMKNSLTKKLKKAIGYSSDSSVGDIIFVLALLGAVWIIYRVCCNKAVGFAPPGLAEGMDRPTATRMHAGNRYELTPLEQGEAVRTGTATGSNYQSR